MIYEPIKVDKLVSQISAVSDNIEDISEEVQNMTDVIGEVEDTIKERFIFFSFKAYKLKSGHKIKLSLEINF